MKALANVNPRDFKDAVEKLRRPNAMAVGGGEPRQHGEATSGTLAGNVCHSARGVGITVTVSLL
ncbi:MAG: hypothetical protein KGM92_08165 [Acidobacteriota bacterium]|nr:hypothetical protein [Acidobacteriota bacterium]